MARIREKNGRFLVFWYENGREKSKTLENRGDAKELKATIEKNLARRRAGLPVSKSYQGFKCEFLAIKKRSAESTYAKYVEVLAHYEALYHPTDLHEITTQRIESWMVLKASQTSNVTANIFFRHFRAFVNKAAAWGCYVELNPVKGIKELPTDAKDPEFLEPGQMASVLESAKRDSNDQAYLMVLWFLSTGCRLSELKAARYEDVSRETKLWRVPSTKEKKAKVLPFLPDLLAALPNKKTGHIFTNQKGGALSRFTIYGIMRRVYAGAGVSITKVHSLRHSFATFALDNGVNIRHLKQMLGHSSIAVTEKYTHVINKRFHEAISALKIPDGKK